MPPAPRTPGRRPFASLTSRLVVTAVALVAVVSLCVGAATTLAMRAYLTDRLDADVTQSLARATGFDRGPNGSPGLPPRPDDGTACFRAIPGQGAGTLTATYDASGTGTSGSDKDTGCVITASAGTQTLSSAAMEVLETVPTDGEVHAVDLPGVGAYRVAALETGSGTVVNGLPTDDVDGVLASLIWWEALLALVGTGVAAAAGLVVVRRQLRPLREVAATAHDVATLPLAEGEVDLVGRVPTYLTDEQTEVGRVGAALDTLLTHVDDAITARHRSEQQVRQFVADASHELRTPLATIAGYAELARRRPDDADAARTALGKVEGESGRMARLVEDLLMLARLDAGRPLAQEPVDVTMLLLGTTADARVLAPDHRWRLELPDEAVEVTGDAHGLHQVVTNLLTNARKYTPAGTTVTVTARPDDDGVRLLVHDDGPGFPEALVPAAFDRFVRGDGARTRVADAETGSGAGGSGLGLALVRAIVQAHGGSVGLRSRPGDTTVEVLVPRGPATLTDGQIVRQSGTP